MQKIDSFKEKLFQSILNPLKEENLSEEYHSLLTSMLEFNRRFSALETKYAVTYARILNAEQQLTIQ